MAIPISTMCLRRIVTVSGVIGLLYAVVVGAQSTRSPTDPDDGRTLFTRIWTVEEGLGPALNARNCASCHGVPTIGGSGTDPRALVMIATGIRDPTGGHVFRRLRVSPTGAVSELQPPEAVVLRKPPPLFGSGVLEAIPEAEIGMSVDPDDADHDGISGRLPTGRFGRKGQFRTLDDVVAAAFINELGLGSAFYPDPSEAASARQGIELTPSQLRATSTFIRMLPVSTVTRARSVIEEQGAAAFDRIGCTRCHRPSYRVAGVGTVSPYTDLLLHDMGPALADGVEEGTASGREFKTPPLWAIGQTGPPYLHDGRANTLEDAIAQHGA